jgi:hypothetical protein
LGLRDCPAFLAVGVAVPGGMNLGMDDAERVGAAAVTALLFGIVPALTLPGRCDADVLRATPGSSGDRFSQFFRRALVVTQIAAALMLLAAAATVVRTVSNLMRFDIGV